MNRRTRKPVRGSKSTNQTNTSRKASRDRIKQRKRAKLRTNRMKKLPFLRFGFMVCIAALVVRIAYWMWVHGEEFTQRAIAQQMNSITESTLNPNRGNILDRNHQALAMSFTVYTVILDVRLLMNTGVTYENRERTLSSLSEVLGVSRERLNGYIAINPETGLPARNTHFLPIERQVDRLKKQELESRNLVAVFFEDDTQRTYIHGNLAAQVIGFQRGDAIWGLENRYNSEMVGETGRIFRMFNNNGHVVNHVARATPGNTLVTTLDLMIQQFAEESVVKWGREFQAERASAIVMNPNTGAIYAMASYPSFDLNNPTDLSGINRAIYAQEWGNLSPDQQLNNLHSIWRNFNIQDTFEPGSIFKPITVAAALEEGLIRFNDIFFCGGVKHFPELRGVNRHAGLPCHNLNGHGYQNIAQALANSCNVATMDIAEILGRQLFFDYQRDFGYGQLTGIDLPGETSASALVYTLAQLNNVELATSSFGQGFNATPIQTISSFAPIINGGYLFQPHLVSQIIDSTGRVVHDFSPVIKRRVISREVSDFLRVAMQDTLTEGTGTRTRIDGFNIGGKTGTGQQGNRDDGINTLTFITYFPVENPQYLVQVILHRVPPEPYVIGATTAHMSRELMQNIINHSSIPPSYDIATAGRDIGHDSIMPDFTGVSLRETVQMLDSMGLSYQMVGASGSVVTSQSPRAGSVVTENVNVLLFIGSDGNNSVELVPVPDLIGMDSASAVRILNEYGFDAIISVEPSTTGFDEGLVFEQIPDRNVRLATDSYVTVRVVEAPPSE